MYPLNPYFQNQLNNKKGFSLIELLIGLSIGSIVATSLCLLLLYCNNANEFAEEKEDVMLNGVYAIEYMEDEIRKADEIIAIEKIEGYKDKFNENFGFVILQKDINKNPPNNHILYYLENDCIKRASYKSNVLPRAKDFKSDGGTNTLVGNVKSINNSYIDFNNSIISIDLLFSSKWNRGTKFHTDIHIRCPVKY